MGSTAASGVSDRGTGGGTAVGGAAPAVRRRRPARAGRRGALGSPSAPARVVQRVVAGRLASPAHGGGAQRGCAAGVRRVPQRPGRAAGAVAVVAAVAPGRLGRDLWWGPPGRMGPRLTGSLPSWPPGRAFAGPPAPVRWRGTAQVDGGATAGATAMVTGTGEPVAGGYALALDPAELARYRLMAERARTAEAELWRMAGVRPGARVADVGCGPGALLPLLAAEVAPDGEVVGVDGDPGAVAAATAYLAGAERVSVGRAPADA